MIELPRTIAANIEHFTGRTWLLPTLLDWFEKSNERIFILTGGPGTGKSMIMAWLAGYGPTPVDPEVATQLESIRQNVKATHFCMAASRNNSPQALAENLANQLTSNVRGFGDALASTLEERVQLTVAQNVQTVAEGGNVTGISIGRIDLGTLSDEESFDRAFTKPLKKLYSDGYKEPILLLIDALDEAQTYTGNISLIKILTSLNDLPQQVRILTTTRPDPRVLKYFKDVPKFDLIENAPNNVDDIREYVTEQLANLQTIGADQRVIFSDRLSQATQGIFLYAYMVLNDFQYRFPNVPDTERYPLPIGLSGFYHEFLNRELGKDEDRWYETFRPLLGLIAVSYSEGLTRTQLQKMVGKDIEQALRVCKQYLAGDLPEGPFRPFHRSFVDFLLEDEKNIDYHIDSMSIHSQIVDYYRNKAPSWEKVDWRQFDNYGLLHLAYHMKEAGKEEELHKLLLNYEWMSTKLKNVYIPQESGEKKPDVNSLLKDYDYLPGDKEIELVQGAIRLSTSALIKDETQLAGQLLGRLGLFPEIEIVSMMEYIRAQRNGMRILPLTGSLTPPDGPLLRTLEGHSDVVNSVSVSPDGDFAVSGSSDYTLKVWDLQTGKEVKTLTGHPHFVSSVCVTSDGNYAVSASYDKTLKVWDLKTGTEVRTLIGHTELVNAVCVTSDGNYAVSASYDKKLKIWDLKTGKEIRTLTGHSEQVNAVCVTRDGNFAVSGSDDKTLKVWDLKTGTEIYTLTGHSERVNAVCVTRDGNFAVSGSDDKKLKVWDLKTGKEVKTLIGHSFWVTAVCVTTDGNYAVSASDDKKLKVWDLKTGKEVKTLIGHSERVKAVCVTTDGNFAVSASDDRTLKVWDLKTGNEVRIINSHSSMITAISITSDGKYAVSASFDTTLKVWDIKTGTEVHTLTGHSDPVYVLTLTPDGKYAISASWDKTLKVWDIKTGTEVHTLTGHSDRITSVSITPDGKLAVSASWDKKLKVWDLKTGTEVHTLTGHSEQVNAVSITPDGNYAISASDDRTLKIWDLKTGEEIRTLTGHSYSVNAISVTSDGKYVTSASSDRTLKVWDIRTGKKIRAVLTELSGSITAVSFTSDGNFAVSALDYDNTLKYWNLKTGKEIKTLTGHYDVINAVSIIPDGNYVVSASWDKTLRVWDLKTGKEVSAFNGDSIFECVVFSPDGTVIVAGEESGRVHFLLFEQGSE